MKEFEGLSGDALSIKLFEEIEKNFPNQCDKVFNSPYCEIEPSFMGFVDQYYGLSLAIPKEYIVLDLGSYVSAQGYFFQNHRKYIGIDCYDGERFKFKNGINLKKNIEEVVDKWGNKPVFTKNVFVICNYASSLLSEKYQQKMKNGFCNIFNFYPTVSK
jgi:hypothetical protein